MIYANRSQHIAHTFKELYGPGPILGGTYFDGWHPRPFVSSVLASDFYFGLFFHINLLMSEEKKTIFFEIFLGMSILA